MQFLATLMQFFASLKNGFVYGVNKYQSKVFLITLRYYEISPIIMIYDFVYEQNVKRFYFVTCVIPVFSYKHYSLRHKQFI